MSPQERCRLITLRSVWRIVIGLSLIPAFGTLYQRLTLPESTRFKESQKIGQEEDGIADLKKQADVDVASADSSTNGSAAAEKKGPAVTSTEEPVVAVKKAHMRGMYHRRVRIFESRN